MFIVGSPSLRITTPQTVQALELIGDSVRWAIGLRNLNQRRSHSRILAACVIYHTKHPESATEFLERYITSVGWRADSPELALDAWRNNNPTMINFGTQLVSATACSLKYHHDKKGVKIIRPNTASNEWLKDLNKTLSNKIATIVT
jgi:hypothetical protein